VSALPDADNRFHTPVARELLLREAGVPPSMAMTPEDHDLVAITPDFNSRTFTNLFGGSSYNERPKSGVCDTLCINTGSQPYAPQSPGASGLVFLYPDAVVPEDTCETFLLFFNMNPKQSRTNERQIRYLGTYTKVPFVPATVEPEEWLSLPVGASEKFPALPAVRLFLMAHCSVVKNGYIVFILQRELMCVQEYLYANRVRVGPHPQQMPFASGLTKIQGNRTV
jgi:hypothetical protein